MQKSNHPAVGCLANITHVNLLHHSNLANMSSTLVCAPTALACVSMLGARILFTSEHHHSGRVYRISGLEPTHLSHPHLPHSRWAKLSTRRAPILLEFCPFPPRFDSAFHVHIARRTIWNLRTYCTSRLRNSGGPHCHQMAQPARDICKYGTNAKKQTHRSCQNPASGCTS